jgi:ParB family chromosome partitioning protein
VKKDNISGVKLETRLIKNHPKNVRKEYDPGDIGELADSIRNVGLLQPLVVVPEPGHEEEMDSFFVVIGNRRLLAAKEAGLSNVPCSIAFGMSEREQAEMMIQENMQRKDLTPYEEGQAFQILLDLGADVEDVAERTGLSRQTVRHRLEIARLDKEAVTRRLTKDEHNLFQLSLFDLQRLERVADVGKRNEILNTARSSENLAWLVNEAVRSELSEKVRRDVLPKVQKSGVKPASPTFALSLDTEMVCKVECDGSSAKNTEKLLAAVEKAKEGGAEVRFTESGGTVTVYRKPPVDRAKAAAEEARKAREDREKQEEAKKETQLAAATRKAVQHIRDMVLDVVQGRLEHPYPDREARLLYDATTEILMDMQGTLSVRNAAAYYEGISGRYGNVNPENVEAVKGLPGHYKMLLLAGFWLDDMDSRGVLVAYGRRYESARMLPVWAMMKLLKPYGCELTGDEKRTVFGQSDLYLNPQKSGWEDEEDD